MHADSAADGGSTGLKYGNGVSLPFWKGLGPRIFCLIFGSRNAYFGEFYSPFIQCAKNISEKNNNFALS